MGKVEADCGESVEKEGDEENKGVDILKHFAHHDDDDHDGDDENAGEGGYGEPADPVKPAWQPHHLHQLFNALLLLLYYPLEDQGHREGEGEHCADGSEEELDDLEDVNVSATHQRDIGHWAISYQLKGEYQTIVHMFINTTRSSYQLW